MESAGMPLEGAETKIDNIDPVNGDGEICMRGRHIFMGYLNDPKKTEEALDKDGWIHSGDLGKTDEDGYLYITGRIKVSKALNDEFKINVHALRFFNH